MAYIHFFASAVLALAATPAFAVYKCKDATGRTVFQERACEAIGAKGAQIDVRPAAGPTPAPPPTVATQDTLIPTPMSEAQRLRALNEKSAKQRRVEELRDHRIPAAQASIRRSSNSCKTKISSTGSQKAHANNNLAGAVWEQSISAEMQAIATQCAAEQTRLNAELDRLIAEQSRLEQELAN